MWYIFGEAGSFANICLSPKPTFMDDPFLHFVVGVVPVGGDEEVVVVGGVVAGLGQDVVTRENDSRSRRRLEK